MDELQEEDTDIRPSSAWDFFLYFRSGAIKPLIRGTLFGLGHYISLKLLGPFIMRRLSITIS